MVEVVERLDDQLLDIADSVEELHHRIESVQQAQRAQELGAVIGGALQPHGPEQALIGVPAQRFGAKTDGFHEIRHGSCLTAGGEGIHRLIQKRVEPGFLAEDRAHGPGGDRALYPAGQAHMVLLGGDQGGVMAFGKIGQRLDFSASEAVMVGTAPDAIFCTKSCSSL